MNRSHKRSDMKTKKSTILIDTPSDFLATVNSLRQRVENGDFPCTWDCEYDEPEEFYSGYETPRTDYEEALVDHNGLGQKLAPLLKAAMAEVGEGCYTEA
jgi:hypothetical protein